jgi:glycosyltransferase involved in cell wall biosynthesis
VRVLGISSYGGLGGAELAMAAFIAHRPADADVRVLLVEDGALRERLVAGGLEVAVARGFSGRPDLRAIGRFSRGLARLLRRDRPDVVWANGLKAAVLALPACRAAGVPLVWHKVDLSYDRALAGPLAWAADGVVTVSEAAAAALGPARGRLLGVVGVPLTLPDELRIPPAAAPAIGTLARLVPYKGLHHIVGAAALLRAEFPELRVILAGDDVAQYPGYRAELERQAAEAGVALELPGFVDDVATVLRELTVFVSATYRDEQGYGLEALGAAILEASWAGLPVVAARGGGTDEAVRDGVTGTLVAAAEPAPLAAAIAPYLRDDALARRTGEAGAAFARREFAPAASAEKLFSALAQAGGRTAPPSPPR